MNLITLEEFKNFSGIKKPDEDAKHEMLISMVSALIQTYLGLDFEGGKTVTETLTLDYDSDTIYLSNYPVSTILSVSETDRYTWDSTVHVPLVYSADYILNGPDGALIRQYKVGGFANWPISPGVITVNYITAPKWGLGGGIPLDLKLAVIELVKYYKDEEYRQSKTIQGTSIVNTLAAGEDFPKHIQVILDKYK